MKNNRIITLVILTLFLYQACKKDNSPNSPAVNHETIALGAGYVNDVYYSAEKGIIGTSPRSSWDIAFHTNMLSSTILANNASGVNVYTYPGGDTAAWNSVSIAQVSQWSPMYNSDTTWTFGAFEQNTLHGWDYGWAVYNQQTHDLVGDSLFVIQLQDQSYKKLWIRRKISTLNKYILTSANIDGSGAKTDTIDCSAYTDKNFVYFSLADHKIINREPASDAWDFVATRYVTKIPAGPGTYMNYTVTGILTNNITIVNNINNTTTNTGTLAAVMQNTPSDSADYHQAAFKTNISEIGYDWKIYNQQMNAYSLADRRVYFIKNRSGKIFKLVFTGFNDATGEIKFDQTQVN